MPVLCLEKWFKLGKWQHVNLYPGEGGNSQSFWRGVRPEPSNLYLISDQNLWFSIYYGRPKRNWIDTPFQISLSSDPFFCVWVRRDRKRFEKSRTQGLALGRAKNRGLIFFFSSARRPLSRARKKKQTNKKKLVLNKKGRLWNDFFRLLNKYMALIYDCS